MSKRENFTAGRVAAFQCEAGKNQSIYWDGKTPGLGLRITPAGAKSYIFETRLHGKTLRMTIGDVRTWAIDQAQAEATRLKAMTDKGDDPRQVKAEKLAAIEAKREETKNAEAPALNAWVIYVKARTPRWSARSLIDHQRLTAEGGKPKTRGRKKGEGDKTISGILRPLLALPLAKIDTDRVRAWLKDETNRPTQANNAFVRLRAFLNWCADRPEYRAHIHANACASRIARDELPKRAAKDDCLQREQLKSWFEKVLAISNPTISAYLQITLLTGARREEVAGMLWKDVDFQWKSIRIADKVDGERSIPMTPYVESLLADLKRRNETPPARYRILDGKKIENDLENWKPSEWVFQSRRAQSGRLQDPSIQHRAACASAGIVGLTIHGLRRSFGTLAEWVEVPAGVVAQLMGHKPSATAEKHY
ncbi:MAG: integrase family protein, partial [Betaproteobacteria bacterium]